MDSFIKFSNSMCQKTCEKTDNQTNTHISKIIGKCLKTVENSNYFYKEILLNGTSKDIKYKIKLENFRIINLLLNNIFLKKFYEE